MSDSPSTFELVLKTATDAGFTTAGIATVPEPGSLDDYAELQLIEAWIADGRAGEMEYLKRRDEAGRLLRSSLRIALPWARSVIVCAANYNSAAPKSIDPAQAGQGWIARYAWSGQVGENGVRPSDYHKVLLARLKNMESRLKESLGDFQSHAYVDTGPVVERIYAKYAGIGWTGKNTCILNQQLGSWLFLGVIATSIELPALATVDISPDRCGSCRRCIEACPTDALTAPYQMDASLCISYLTIEKRGEIPLDLRTQIGRQVFGCDICQDVCPWNRKAPITGDKQLQTREELINPALAWLAEMDDAVFGKTFYGSPVKRTKISGLHRNVAIAMGNSQLREFLPKLREWSQSTDTVLAETSAWAIAQIEAT
jgi:epoxyqueuosine reductase